MDCEIDNHAKWQQLYIQKWNLLYKHDVKGEFYINMVINVDVFKYTYIHTHPPLNHKLLQSYVALTL